MIAQDFARVRVLASGSIAAAYGGAEHVRARGQKTSEGAAAQSVSRRTRTKRMHLIEGNHYQLYDKRLGEMCGPGCSV